MVEDSWCSLLVQPACFSPCVRRGQDIADLREGPREGAVLGSRANMHQWFCGILVETRSPYYV